MRITNSVQSLFNPRSPASGWPSGLLAVVLASFAVPLAGSAQAATYQWDVSGSTATLGGAGTWNTTNAYWNLVGTSGTVAYTFSSSDTAIFGGTPGTVTLVNGTTYLPAININSGGYTFNIGGNASATFSGPITLCSTGATTFSCGNNSRLGLDGGLNLNGGTLVLNQGSSAKSPSSFNAGISGTGTINVGTVGSGAEIFTANTYSGITNLNGNTLDLNAATALGTSTLVFGGGILDCTLAGGVTLTNSNAQNWNSDFTFVGTQSLNMGVGAVTLGGTGSGRTVTVSANTLTVGGAISGSGYSLTKAGSGTLVLGGSNSYSGGTTVSAGVLSFSTSSAVPAQGLITIGAAGVLAATPVYNPATTSPVSDWLANGPIAPNPTGAIALTNGTSDSETITLSATTSALSLGAIGSATYSGVLTPSGSTVYLGGGGGTLLLTNSLAGSNSLVVGNAGGGTVVLVNNFTGPTTITAGTLQLGTGNMGQDGSLTGGTITNNGVLAYNLYGNQTYSGVISGSGGVTMAGNNSTLTLTGSNNYTGPTTVSAGILNYQNALAFGGSSAITVAVGATVQVQGGIGGGSQPMTISGTGAAGATGALENVSGTNTYAGLLTLGGNATISSDAGSLALTNTGTITGAKQSLTLTGAGNGSITGAIGTTTGGLTVNGPGAWTLLGASTYTGATTVNGGTLQVGNGTSGNLGNTPVTVNGGVLSLQNAGAVSQNTVTVAGGVLSETVPNAIGGSAGLTITGGTADLSLSNSFSGTTLLNGGTLLLANSGAMASSALSIGDGGVAETILLRNDNSTTFATSGSSISLTNGTTIVAIDVDRLSTNNSSITGNTLALGNFAWPGSIQFSNTMIFTNNGGNANYNLSVGTVSFPTNLAFTNNMFNGTTTLAAVTLTGSGSRTVTFNGSSGTALTSVGPISQGTGTLALNQSGSGTLLLVGANTYTGATTVNSGILAFGTSGSLGNTPVTVNGGILLMANSGVIASATLAMDGGTLQLRNDNSTTFATSGSSVSIGGNVTIDVDRADASGGTGKTLALGAVSMANGNNITFTNNTSSGTANYNLLVGAVSASGTAIFTNNMSQGTATLASLYQGITSNRPAIFNGTSASAVTSVGPMTQNLTHALSIIQSGSGTLLLTGSNTYTGATTVSSGALLLGGSGSLGSTAVSVTGGATFGLAYASSGNVVNGGSSLNLASGATLNLVDGYTNTMYVSGGGTLAGAGLDFDLGGSTCDVLALSGSARMSGTNMISVSALAGASILRTGTGSSGYALVTAASGGLVGGDFLLSATSLQLSNGNKYTLTTYSTSTAEYLDVAAAATATSATYTLSASAALTNIHVSTAGGANSSTRLYATLTNTGTGTADTLNYSGLGMNASGGTVSGATSSGSLGQQASFTNSLQTFAASVAGSYSLSAIVASATNATAGGNAVFSGSSGVTVNVYNLAAPNAVSGAIGNYHVNVPVALTLINGTYGPYNEDLNASLSGGTGAVVSGSVTGLISGGTNNASLQVSLSGAGPQTAGANLSLVSAGSVAGVSNGLGLTSQNSQTLSISGTGWNYAVPSLATSSVTLAPVHMGGTFGTQALTVQNNAPGSYSEALDAAFGSLTGNATTNGGAISLLAANSADSSTMVVGLGSGGQPTAGTLGGSVTLSFSSDGTGAGNSGLGVKPLSPQQTVTVQGMVFSGSAQWTNGHNTSLWSDNYNWTDLASNATAGAPGLSGSLSANDTATFVGSNSASITLDVSPTVAALTFSNSAGITLTATSTNSLNLEATSGMAMMTALSGANLISAPVVMGGSGSLAVSMTGGASLQLAGSVSDGGSGQGALVLDGDGSGTLILSGTGSFGGGTTVDAGALILESPTALLDGSSLTVGDPPGGGGFVFDHTPAGSSLPAAAGSSFAASPAMTFTAVPEPGTLALLAVAGIFLAAAAWRRRRN